MNSKHFVVVYMNHAINSIIINQIKFIFNNVDELNLKLIRIFIYLFQFRFRVFHKTNKSNIIFDVLNRLFIIRYFVLNVKIDNFDLKTYYFETSTFDKNDNVI